ncbi:MAG: thiolase family protein [Synergistes jonesii]|uniref:thiolase family protein n=1 Tax=Synergistes jonesii TaxID=2754 RepID=UPI002A750D8B|nr:thiolase family protein [Synergistes jonesii]MDY2985704.1 thiolase family protein [Synergistes jonesii]
MTKKDLRDAVIVSTARTPVGKFRGALATISAPDLAAFSIKEAVRRSGVASETIDEVIIGNVYNTEWANISRVSVHQAGLPLCVPAFAINRVCSSSLNALAVASVMIKTGNYDTVVTGGVESYSQQPHNIRRPGTAYPETLEVVIVQSTGPALGKTTMITTAENLAKKYGLTRKECDEFSVLSHQKAANAWNNGWFDEQVVPFSVPQRKGPDIVFKVDECVRFDMTYEMAAKLKPVIDPYGIVTAANSSPRNDASAAVVVMSREKAHSLGIKPLAVVREFAAAGCDPHIMGIGPVYSTRKLFEKTGYTIKDFDLIELNEAFAAQSIPCIRELNIDMDKLNVEGGAIAIGHPNGASGSILTARMVYALKRRNLERGLISFCCAGGQGFSLIIENED